jgi:hypothetical protein
MTMLLPLAFVPRHFIFLILRALPSTHFEEMWPSVQYERVKELDIPYSSSNFKKKKRRLLRYWECELASTVLFTLKTPSSILIQNV